MLKEGLFWAALGRPSEVIPFLKGKLLSNGYREITKRDLKDLIRELEIFYEAVSWQGRIEEKHMRAIKSFHRDIVSIIHSDRGA